MDSSLLKLPEWVVPVAPMAKLDHVRNRNLYDADDYDSYLVDSKGNQYEPYSMAWRYLGMYIDCDIQQEGGNDYDESNIYRKLTRQLFGSRTKTPSKRRGLGSGSGDGDDCSRKVLWAAYHDPHYRGNEIGEYQFYDHISSTWDDSTCETMRCAKMNCHASRSQFQLIGVFKEADGLTDWAEQLFKHEGYCIWNGDKDDEEGSGSGDGNDGTSNYEFMSNRQDYIPQGCSSMYLSDNDGNAVYRGLMPLPGGNITEGLYTDEDCTQKSRMSFSDYIVKWYSNYYYDEEKGESVAANWAANTEQWNALMVDYHVCQPCRAYNKVQMYEDEDRLRRRRLDEDDGGGDEEKWGYNCYDDAGYRNCNQCYKFETKTDMEPASTEDLERASDQGTILAIKVDGVTYGKGGIDWHDVEVEIQVTLWILGAAAAFGIMFLLSRRYKSSILSRHFQKNLREVFLDDSTDAMDPEEDAWLHKEEELARNRRIIEKQRHEIEQIKLELDQENSIRGMEWELNQHRRAEAAIEHEKKEPKFQPEPDEEGMKGLEVKTQVVTMPAELSLPSSEMEASRADKMYSEQAEQHGREEMKCAEKEIEIEFVAIDEGEEKLAKCDCTEGESKEEKDTKENSLECQILEQEECNNEINEDQEKDEVEQEGEEKDIKEDVFECPHRMPQPRAKRL
mmetsp:Transcript_27570/g.60689  ORF Transcript_27570/g.60689 Transcript_27570/m.60689 type:complete len:676 (-) Transcript_27570:323-2350(-)